MQPDVTCATLRGTTSVFEADLSVMFSCRWFVWCWSQNLDVIYLMQNFFQKSQAIFVRGRWSMRWSGGGEEGTLSSRIREEAVYLPSPLVVA